MKIQKLLALTLALILTLTLFTACGKKDAENNTASQPAAPETDEAPVETDPAIETEPADVTGQMESYGDYSVLVPAGYSLEGPASEFSYYDFNVQKSAFYYFYFITTDDDDRIMRDYEYNKNTYTNEQEDVAAVYGENAWTGFQYSDGWGGYGFEVYATVGGKLVRVSSAGYRFDSPEAEAILGSLSAN